MKKTENPAEAAAMPAMGIGSAVRAAAQPVGIPSDFTRHVANNETTPVLVSVD